jgi:type I restriction enzyme R subunit
VFGSEAAEVFKNSDGTNHAKNARVHVATYQTLDVDSEDGTANFLTANYPPDYFSHIIIDECHRSAWGKWSQVFTRNPNAVQIGLTATPRQLIAECPAADADTSGDAKITADNIKHFGEPVYEYDIAQGIDDGYLAACDIRRGRVDIDDTGITIDQILALNRDANRGADYARSQSPVRKDGVRRSLAPAGSCLRDGPRPFPIPNRQRRTGTKDDHLLRPRPPRRRRGDSDE